MKVACYQCRAPADPRWFLHRADGPHPACDGCGCAGATDQLCAFCQGAMHERERLFALIRSGGQPVKIEELARFLVWVYAEAVVRWNHFYKEPDHTIDNSMYRPAMHRRRAHVLVKLLELGMLRLEYP